VRGLLIDTENVSEVATDPFGNYLCQKLLEYSTDDQRNVICESVAGDLVTISLNMHGTRAVQKMIDFLSTQRQVRSIPRLPSPFVPLRAPLVCLKLVCLEQLLSARVVTLKTLTTLSLSLPHNHSFMHAIYCAHNVLSRAPHRHLSLFPFILG
jgi:Pumilio-family RNA binding repeat